MTQIITKGSVDQSIDVFIPDSSSTTGAGRTGLAHDTAGLVCHYHRPGAVHAELTLATQTVTGAHADGGFVEIDSNDMPGIYRLDLSDAIVATGVDFVTLQIRGAADMVPVSIRIRLADFDLNSATVDVGAINGNIMAAVRLALSAGIAIIPGTVDTATNTHTPTTTEFQADDITEATTDHFAQSGNERGVIFTNGALLGQYAKITGYDLVGGIGQFTVQTMTDAPANNDEFIII